MKAEAYGKTFRRTVREDESPDAYIAGLQMWLPCQGTRWKPRMKTPCLLSSWLRGSRTSIPRNFICQPLARSIRTVGGWIWFVLNGQRRWTHLLCRPRPQTPSSSHPTMRGWPMDSQAVCFECIDVGDAWRNCPLRQCGIARETTCFFCDGRGHVELDCNGQQRMSSVWGEERYRYFLLLRNSLHRGLLRQHRCQPRNAGWSGRMKQTD